MREYLIKRIAVAFGVLFIIASLNFFIFQVVSPIQPTDLILNPEFTAEMKARLIAEFGLDQPLHIRYIKYLRQTFLLDFGLSFDTRVSVKRMMAPRLVNTIILLGSALIATIIVGIPVGILAASRRGSKADVAAIGVGLMTWGVPTFFIQLLSMLLLSYYVTQWTGVQIFPVRGVTDVPTPTNPLLYIADVLRHLAQPLMTLVVAGFGSWALYTRNLLLDALTQDYIVTARAKGLSERTVLYRHAFRSTLPPIITMVALAVPGVVTGAMITEYIFTWPGIGRWYLHALMGADYPVVQAVLFIYAILMIVANFSSDIVYGLLDPRIRVGARR